MQISIVFKCMENSSYRTPWSSTDYTQRPEVDSVFVKKFLFLLMGCKANVEQFYPSGCFSIVLFFVSYFPSGKQNQGVGIGMQRTAEL